MSEVRQMVGRSIAAAALLLAVASSAYATTISFYNDDGTGSFGNGSVGNTRTWVTGGVTVTATAWYANSNNFATAALGLYSGAGLGVCNSQEWGSDGFPCSSPNHAIDNYSQYDFVLFSFSSAVNLQEVGLYRLRDDDDDYFDTDVSFWLGSGVTTLATKALNNMPAGFGGRVDVNNSTTVDLQPGNLTYTSLLFGANSSGSDRDDRFKIKTLTFDVVSTQPLCEPVTACTPTPEPASLVLFGTGLAGLATVIRRRARRA